MKLRGWVLGWWSRFWAKPWLSFLLASLLLLALQALAFSLSAPPDAAFPTAIVAFNSFFVPYLLALLRYLDRQSRHTLQVMRPVLEISAAAFKRLVETLGATPQGPALLAGLLMLLFAVGVEISGQTPSSYTAIPSSTVFAALYYLIDKVGAFVFGLFVFHIYNKLRMFTMLANQHARVRLFNLRPLQALSKFSGAIALGLLAAVYGWIVINPELLREWLVILFLLGVTGLAALVFLLPLLGLHRRMVAEKDILLQTLDQRFEDSFAAFDRALAAQDGKAIELLSAKLSGMQIQYERLDSIPTWPWKPETAQLVTTAIALPMLIALAIFVLEQSLI